MKALVKYQLGEGNVKVMDVEKPVLKPGEVLIRVMAAGICGTDIHILSDDSYPIKPPVTLGHELSGEVAEVAADVTDWKVGDRVVSETYYYTCGKCIFCKTGKKNLCEDRLSIGSGVNGAMAEFVAVPAGNLHKISNKLSFEEACMTEPLACCVQAVFEKATLSPSDYVVLTGPGTIGLLTLQAIKLFGCKILVLGTKKDEERLKLAKELGATETLYVDDENLDEKIKAFCGGIGATVAFDCSGAGPAINLCLNSLRKGGHFVQVGIAGKPVSIDMAKVALREISIIGTFAQKPIWWDKSIELLEDGKITLKPLLSGAHKIEDWETGFKAMIAGEGFKHIIVPNK